MVENIITYRIYISYLIIILKITNKLIDLNNK